MKFASTSSNAIPPAVEIARAMGAKPVTRIGTAWMSPASIGAGIVDKRSVDASAASCNTDLDRRQTQRLAQERRERLLAARCRKTPFQVGHSDVGAQVDVQQRLAIAGVADGRAERIDAAAFEPALRDDRFGANRMATERQRDPLERMAVKARAKEFRPSDQDPAIGGAQRRDRDPATRHRVDPATVGAKARPACAAECKHLRIGFNRDRPIGPDQDGAPIAVPPGPAVTQDKPDTDRPQMPEPGPQQGRSFERGRKDAPARANEFRLAEAFAPCPQR
jgi:hypothetical protein